MDDLEDVITPWAKAVHALLEFDEETDDYSHYVVLKAGSSRKTATVAERIELGEDAAELARVACDVVQGWAGGEERLYLMCFAHKAPSPSKTLPIPVHLLDAPSKVREIQAQNTAADTMARELARLARHADNRASEAQAKVLSLSQTVADAYLTLREGELEAQYDQQPPEWLEAIKALSPALAPLVGGVAAKMIGVQAKPAELTDNGHQEEAAELPPIPELTDEQADKAVGELAAHLARIVTKYPKSIPRLEPLLTPEVIQNLLALA